MSVSQAFLDAGKAKARAHAIQLVCRHAPTLAGPYDADAFQKAQHGLAYARMLGRQHSFESDVILATETILELLRTPGPQRLARLKGMVAAMRAPTQLKEAAE